MSQTIRAVIHADLSDTHASEEHHLWADGDRHPLRPHTQETRAMARNAAPHLQAVPDHALTHFAENVSLPANSVLRIHTLQTTKSFANPATGHAPGLVAIYVPPADPNEPVHLRIDYASTAKAMLYHHPDLITHDPDVGRMIKEHIDSDAVTKMIDEIVVPLMRMNGPARPDKGWAHLKPFTPPLNPKTHMDGKTTRYEVHPIPEVKDALGPAMTSVLKAVKNDLRLEGKKWHQEVGKSVTPAAAPPRALANMANVDARGTGSWQPSLADDRRIHGLEFSIESVNAEQRQLRIHMRNYFIRYLGAYIRFYDAFDNPISLPGWKPVTSDTDVDVVREVGIQYDEVHYIGFLSPVANVFAVPIMDSPGTLDVTVQFPENAVRASIYGSGLGRGSNDWANTPVVGGVLTGLVNLGIPSYMLATQVAAVVNKVFYGKTSGIMAESRMRQLLIAGGMVYFGNTARKGNPDFHALISMSQLLFNEGATDLLLAVQAQIAVERPLEAIPFAGWVLMALNIACGIAQLAETISEVSSSRWNIENIVATSITSAVTVHPDPRHMAFPQALAGTQASYTVRMMFRGNRGDARATRTYSTNVSASTPVTLPASFPNNTLGGEVRFEVDYHIDTWLAGTASSGWIKNDKPNATQVDLFLVENPKPLDRNSVYVHSAILIYDNGQYAWKPTGTAPTATVANRDSSGPNGITEWYGISLSQRCAMLGFAWKAAGMGIVSMPSGSIGQVAAMQNVDIPGRTMVSAKFPPYGFDDTTQLMYDPYPAKFQMRDGNWVLGPDHNPLPDPSDVRLGDYYLDPRPAGVPLLQGGGYHLRRVTLDPSTPFDLDNTQSYGRFEFPADSFALHPAGFVIGVSTKNKKIQTLPIASTPSSDADSIIGDVYAGEALNDQRRGLLFKPVAVACSYDGTIFVLEDLRGTGAAGNARIQAFDLLGNPVPCFVDASGAASAVLSVGDAATTVLDIAAVGNEVTTYLYVLSHQNDGLQVSDYNMSIYTRGSNVPPQQPLVTTNGLAAAKIAVDMWHGLYALNYAMTTNAAGQPSGPAGDTTGPAGRTVPSISEWLPPIPRT